MGRSRRAELLRAGVEEHQGAPGRRRTPVSGAQVELLASDGAAQELVDDLESSERLVRRVVPITQLVERGTTAAPTRE